VVAAVPTAGPGPGSYTITSREPLLFTAADWIQNVRGTGVEVVPTVMIFDQSGALVARMEGPSVFVP
jgi:peptide subunit release factor RF-3